MDMQEIVEGDIPIKSEVDEVFENDASEFADRVEELYKQNKTDEVAAYFKPDAAEFEANWRRLIYGCLELSSVVARKLNELCALKDRYEKARPSNHDLLKQANERFLDCEFVMLKLLQYANPKEVLLGFLGALEEAKSDEFFCLMVSWLTLILDRMVSVPSHVFLWACRVVYGYLYALPVKDLALLETAESATIDACPSIKRIERCLDYVFEFCQKPFRTPTGYTRSTAAFRHNRLVFATFLLKILDRPLSYCCYYTKADLPKRPAVTDYVERCVQMLLFVSPNLIGNIINFTDAHRLVCEDSAEADDYENAQINVTDIAYGTLLYVTMVQQLYAQSVPQVFCPFYFWFSSLHSVIALLKSGSDELNAMGIQLADALLEKFFSKSAKRSLSFVVHDESPSLTEQLVLWLIESTSRNSSLTSRQRALHTFESIFHAIKAPGQIALIRYVFAHVRNLDDNVDDLAEQCLLPVPQDNGIKGHIIDLYRQKLAAEIDCSTTRVVVVKKENNTVSFTVSMAYAGELISLLDLFTAIRASSRHQNSADLLHVYNQVMATLSLLRYLALVQKNDRFSLTKEQWQKLLTEYIHPLDEALAAATDNTLREMQASQRDFRSLQDDPEADAEEMESNRRIFGLLRSSITSMELMKMLLFDVKEMLDGLVNAKKVK